MDVKAREQIVRVLAKSRERVRVEACLATWPTKIVPLSVLRRMYEAARDYGRDEQVG